MSLSSRPTGASTDEKDDEQFEAHVKTVSETIAKINELSDEWAHIQKASATHQYEDKDVVLKKAMEEFKTQMTTSFSNVISNATDGKGVKYDSKAVEAEVKPVVDRFAKKLDDYARSQFNSWMKGERFDQKAWDEKFEAFKTDCETECKNLKTLHPIRPLPPEPKPPAPPSSMSSLMGGKDVDRYKAEMKVYEGQVENYRAAQKKQEEAKKIHADLDNLQKDQVSKLDTLAKKALHDQMKYLAERSLLNKLEIDQGKANAERLAQSGQLTERWERYGEPEPIGEGDLSLTGVDLRLEDGMYRSKSGHHFLVETKDGSTRISPQPPVPFGHRDFDVIYSEIIQKLMTGKGAEGITIEIKDPKKAFDIKAIQRLLDLCKRRGVTPTLGDNLKVALANQHPSVGQALKELATFGILKAKPSGSAEAIIADVHNAQAAASISSHARIDQERMKQGGKALTELSLEADEHLNHREEISLAKGVHYDAVKHTPEFKESYKKAHFTDGSGVDLPEDKKIEALELEVKSLKRSLEVCERVEMVIESRIINLDYDTANPKGLEARQTFLEAQQEQLKDLSRPFPELLTELRNKADVLKEMKFTDPAHEAKAVEERKKIDEALKKITGFDERLREDVAHPDNIAAKAKKAADIDIDDQIEVHKKAEIERRKAKAFEVKTPRPGGR